MKFNKLVIFLCVVFVGYSSISIAQSKKKKKADTEQNDEDNSSADDDTPKKSHKKSKHTKSADDDDSASDEDYKPQHKAGRVEIEIKDLADNYFTMPVGDDGVIIFGEKAKVKDGKKTWFFKKYSTSLTEVSDKEYEVSKYSFYSKRFYDNASGNLYLFTLYSDKSALNTIVTDVNYTMQIIKYNVRTTKITSYEFAPPLNCAITDFVVKNNVAYFGGRTTPSQQEVRKKMCMTYLLCYIPLCFGAMNFPYSPAFFSYDFKSKSTKVETANYQGNGAVLELSAQGDDSLQTVGALIANRPDKKLPVVYRIKTYEKGELIRSNKMKIKEGDDLQDASIYKIDDQNDMVIGTYAESRKHGSKDVFPYGASKGFYIAKYDNGKQLYYKHFPFEKYFTVEVKNFLGKKKTKAVVSLNLLVHDLVKRGDNEYLIMGDAYYAHYHTETHTDAQGHTYTVQVFDGWVFTSSLIADFDGETGKINWTETFEINSWPPSMNLYPRVKVLKNENSDDLVFVYNDGKNIISKKLHGSSLSDNGQKALPMSLKNSDDKVKAVGGADIAYWYDNYFIAYGFQRIKKKGKLFSGRTVFYLNKINYKTKSSE